MSGLCAFGRRYAQVEKVQSGTPLRVVGSIRSASERGGGQGRETCPLAFSRLEKAPGLRLEYRNEVANPHVGLVFSAFVRSQFTLVAFLS